MRGSVGCRTSPTPTAPIEEVIPGVHTLDIGWLAGALEPQAQERGGTKGPVRGEGPSGFVGAARALWVPGFHWLLQ